MHRVEPLFKLTILTEDTKKKIPVMQVAHLILYIYKNYLYCFLFLDLQ